MFVGSDVFHYQEVGGGVEVGLGGIVGWGGVGRIELVLCVWGMGNLGVIGR